MDERRNERNLIKAAARRQSESLVFDDGTNTFLWRAHTVLALACIIAVLSFIVFTEEESQDIEYNVKRGIGAGILMFMAIGVTQVKDGPFKRPHPILWRFVFCASIAYEIAILFMLFQSANYARFFLTYIDPNLNQPLDFRAYGGNCTIWDPGHEDGPLHNVMDKMDGFVTAHFLGWFMKALIFRDVWMTMVISATFELLEYTFEHQLPNFSECWWDHGEDEACRWTIQSVQLDNFPLETDGEPFSVILLAELNTFYLKFVLWMPPDHPFVLTRLIFFGLWGGVAIREMYDYMNGVSDKFGQQAWMIVMIICTEFLIVLKFGWDVITTPFPAYIRAFWGGALFCYVAWTLWKFQMKFPRVKALIHENAVISERLQNYLTTIDDNVDSETDDAVFSSNNVRNRKHKKQMSD